MAMLVTMILSVWLFDLQPTVQVRNRVSTTVLNDTLQGSMLAFLVVWRGRLELTDRMFVWDALQLVLGICCASSSLQLYYMKPTDLVIAVHNKVGDVGSLFTANSYLGVTALRCQSHRTCG
jgi:hypothetical protein